MQKCRECGARVTRYPVRKNQNRSFWDNLKDGTINWKNMFKMDGLSVAFLIIVLILAFTYKHDVQVCQEIVNDPCGLINISECDNVILLEDSNQGGFKLPIIKESDPLGAG